MIRQILLGFSVAFRVVAWEYLIIALPVFVFGITNVPFGVDDRSALFGIFAVALKILILSFGGITAIGGVSIHFAPLILTALSILIFYRIFRKTKSSWTVYSMISLIISFAIFLFALIGLDCGFDFAGISGFNFLGPALYLLFVPIAIFMYHMIKGSESILKTLSSVFKIDYAAFIFIRRSILQIVCILLGASLALSFIFLTWNSAQFAAAIQTIASEPAEIIAFSLILFTIFPNFLFIDLSVIINLRQTFGVCGIGSCVSLDTANTEFALFLPTFSINDIPYIGIFSAFAVAALGFAFALITAKAKKMFFVQYGALIQMLVVISIPAALSILVINMYANNSIGSTKFSGFLDTPLTFFIWFWIGTAIYIAFNLAKDLIHNNQAKSKHADSKQQQPD